MFKDIQKTDSFIEKLVNVKRHTKTVKGGRIMSFSALVVVGNGKGKVGIGRGKSREVPLAIQKAMENAKRHMITVKLNGKTLWYPIKHSYGATTVFMKPAYSGTGIISGGVMRSVFEASGVHNVLSKIYGSNNPINVIKATINGMARFKFPEDFEEKRGVFIKNF